jgi:hypothetical protein
MAFVADKAAVGELANCPSFYANLDQTICSMQSLINSTQTFRPIPAIRLYTPHKMLLLRHLLLERVMTAQGQGHNVQLLGAWACRTRAISLGAIRVMGLLAM